MGGNEITYPSYFQSSFRWVQKRKIIIEFLFFYENFILWTFWNRESGKLEIWKSLKILFTYGYKLNLIKSIWKINYNFNEILNFKFKIKKFENVKKYINYFKTE